MHRVTLVLSKRIEGQPLTDYSFEELQARVNRSVPVARWAYLGYLGNRFCLDTVVSEQKLAVIRSQARSEGYIHQVLVEPWPAGKGVNG